MWTFIFRTFYFWQIFTKIYIFSKKVAKIQYVSDFQFPKMIMFSWLLRKFSGKRTLLDDSREKFIINEISRIFVKLTHLCKLSKFLRSWKDILDSTLCKLAWFLVGISLAKIYDRYLQGISDLSRSGFLSWSSLYSAPW